MYDPSTWRCMGEDIESLRVEASHYENQGDFLLLYVYCRGHLMEPYAMLCFYAYLCFFKEMFYFRHDSSCFNCRCHTTKRKGVINGCCML